MMKLYDFDKSPSPKRARIFIAEKGLNVDVVQVDLRAQEQLGPDFRKINPRCAVPALETHEGTILTENLSIAAYLEEIAPEPPLMGSTTLERALILEWNWRCEFEGIVAIAEILRNTAPQMKDRAMTGSHNIKQIPELAERGRLRLGHFYECLNEQLTQSEYVASNTFSLADITAFVAIEFSAWVKAQPDESLKALWKWFHKVSERPSAKA